MPTLNHEESEKKYYQEMIKKHYLDLLNREPDDEGLNYHVNLFTNNGIDEKQLVAIIKDSVEYKLVNPLDLDQNTPVDVRMKEEWNSRAKLDILMAISSNSSNENDFWVSGINDCEAILGINQRLPSITKNKDRSQMKILEIGCGIGRILIPMSKIYGEVIGVDISSEMVRSGQKYIENISNCKILECNGINLKLFPNNYFDFCYSYIVFQHIPKKEIVEEYIQEVSRILKPDCLFRFQVRGTISTKPKTITTWNGVQFNSNEMHKIAKKNNFKIIEEGNDKDEYYWLTFQSKK